MQTVEMQASMKLDHMAAQREAKCVMKAATTALTCYRPKTFSSIPSK
jgi:hypothetical protein